MHQKQCCQHPSYVWSGDYILGVVVIISASDTVGSQRGSWTCRQVPFSSPCWRLSFLMSSGSCSVFSVTGSLLRDRVFATTRHNMSLRTLFYWSCMLICNSTGCFGSYWNMFTCRVFKRPFVFFIFCQLVENIVLLITFCSSVVVHKSSFTAGKNYFNYVCRESDLSAAFTYSLLLCLLAISIEHCRSLPFMSGLINMNVWCNSVNENYIQYTRYGWVCLLLKY